MSKKNDNATPCTVKVIPDDKGGMIVTLIVPTSEKTSSRFTLQAERDVEGDWRVYIPWAAENKFWNESGTLRAELPSGEEVCGGILYLSAPE